MFEAGVSLIGLFTPKFQTAFIWVVLRAWCGLRPGQTWCVSPQLNSDELRVPCVYLRWALLAVLAFLASCHQQQLTLF